jgi:hypothetical protein
LWESKNGETPGILDDLDFDEVQDKKYFFARKIDSRYSKNLLNKLEKKFS